MCRKKKIICRVDKGKKTPKKSNFIFKQKIKSKKRWRTWQWPSRWSSALVKLLDHVSSSFSNNFSSRATRHSTRRAFHSALLIPICFVPVPESITTSEKSFFSSFKKSSCTRQNQKKFVAVLACKSNTCLAP